MLSDRLTPRGRPLTTGCQWQRRGRVLSRRRRPHEPWVCRCCAGSWATALVSCWRSGVVGLHSSRRRRREDSAKASRWHCELPCTHWCQQSEDIDERRSLMSAAGCQTGTSVLCRAHNGTPEYTTGTGFAPGRVTSDAPVAVGLCVMTSSASRRAERRHSVRTAVGPAGIQRYPQGPSYTDPTWWWPVFGSVSAGRAEGETVARYGSGAVLQNTLWRRWWLGSSWWRRRRCRHQDPGQQWLATPRHHQHEQHQSGSGVDVVTMHTRGLRSWLDLAAAGLPSSTPKPRQCRRTPAV